MEQVQSGRHYDLYKAMLRQGTFTTGERKVIAKRCLSGKSQNAISTELEISPLILRGIIEQIDRKVLRLQPGNYVSN